jgi:hypothetical protein
VKHVKLDEKMNNREYEEELEPKEKSEWDEYKEIDDARRYREHQSDNRRPY